MAHTTHPPDLPIPTDDGACSHLPNTTIPSITLPTTSGTTIDISTLPGPTVLFCYPRTGAPGETVPDTWNQIPGARGCTPQACSFRDQAAELKKLGVKHVFGASTQDTEYQSEARARLKLPYDLLSDEGGELTKGLGLPTFEWEGKRVLKRCTIVVGEGKVHKVFYPVFPPGESATAVVEWLKTRETSQ